MLRIVEIHPAQEASGEYIVLQNQGVVSINLQGWAVSTEVYLQGGSEGYSQNIYVFKSEVMISPYTHIVLFTGKGKEGWMPTNDGKRAYCAYWERNESIWNHSSKIHLLQMTSTKPIDVPVTLPMPHSA